MHGLCAENYVYSCCPFVIVLTLRELKKNFLAIGELRLCWYPDTLGFMKVIHKIV